MCAGLGMWELLIILAIVVLLFGASKLPQLGKALGETVRNFKSGQAGADELPAKERRPEVEGQEVAQLENKDGKPTSKPD
jgi:sec-independent protein translocase protein TatA